MNLKTIMFLIIGLLIGFLAGFFYSGNKRVITDPLQEFGVKTCNYNGTVYKSGDGFRSDDGCNSCSCENGEVACTTMACDIN